MELTTLETVVALVPALVANGSATLIAKGTPLDRKRHFIDGRRIFGDGKTFEGTLIAILYGFSISLSAYIVMLKHAILVASIAAVLGAIVGDLTGSFIKRRLGLKRGAPVPILDQLDFYVGAVICMYAAGVVPKTTVVLAAAPLVFVLHRVTNYIAYKLGIKEVPW